MSQQQAEQPKAAAPPAPPEFKYTWGRHNETMEALSLGQMARRVPSALRQTARLALAVNRTAFHVLVTAQVLGGICTAAALAAISRAMVPLLTGDGIQERIAAAAWPLVVAAAMTALGALASITSGSAARRLNPGMATLADLAMVDAHMDVELAAYDAPDFTERSEAAETGSARSAMLLQDALGFTGGLIDMVAVASVLAVVHPVLLPLLLLSVIPRGLGSVYAARLDYRLHNQTIASRNIKHMMRWHLTTPKLADELRGNSMRPYAHHWYAAVCERIDSRMVSSAPRYLTVHLTAATASGVFVLATYGALAGLVVGGYMAIAAAGTAIVAMRTSTAALSQLVVYGAAMFQHALYLGDYTAFLAEAAEKSGPRGPQVMEVAPEKIRLEEATYTYPGKDTPSLGPVSLTLSRGEVVAVVGENGAGKSTLIRLLTSLTVPTSGIVSWDGVPTSDTDQRTAWQHVGLVTQSYGYWPFSARENITLGRPDPRGAEAVWDALDAVGLRTTVQEFPNGLDTLLARSVWGGHEPSGGQWQRLACGRAFHRKPGLLVMDEPTSAMDPRGEHMVFSGLRDMKDDRITVIVTHRMENCRLADRIIVLDAGRIIEQGGYEELVRLDGSFAELVRLSQDR
ncbi:ATP-binding cassette domain-containing protein [Streptomyces virginiae]|uniref:ATP-binding cassette domain-containing protein n=1 Tax=Streptomyces virginiae TaxID=1961 RepID=UPI00225613AD|nr:ATP-binding cassette domain-containing protein [Streptomyces virginiae]MCX4960349.1 ATP-binding cassette domain-containing protein [Streptomyces virginiae]